MNERIKELADKAQEYAEWETPQGLEWLDNFKEQFALLIINECASLAEDGFFDDLDGQEICDGIKNHFGV